jgi:hypothetical protein
MARLKNFSFLTGRCAGSWTVHRYFFVIKNERNEYRDDVGTALRDDREAQIYALRIIRELKEGGGYDEGDWTIVVVAEDGHQVCSVPFSAVELPRKRSF